MEPHDDPLDQPAPRPRSPYRSIWIQFLVGAIWGASLSTIPFELLLMTAIIGIPALIWAQCWFIRKLHPLEGFPVCFLTLIATIVGAAAAPAKFEDRTRVGPLPAQVMTARGLAKAVMNDSVTLRVADDELDTLIFLPSVQPTLRELIDAVESRTRARYFPRKCGTGATFLWGGYPIGAFELWSYERADVGLRPDLFQ